MHRAVKISISRTHVRAAGKSVEFVDGSPCSFVAVIDMAFMVYFNFFVCVLVPLVAMFAMYGYIYGIVRRHIARIAAMMPSQAVAVSTVQPQIPAVSHPSTSTSHVVTTTVNSNNVEMTVPITRQGKTLSTVINENSGIHSDYGHANHTITRPSCRPHYASCPSVCRSVRLSRTGS